MVSGVTKTMDPSIWNPESFLRDFGDIKNDLVNCLTGNTVPNQPMKKFWEGFERLTKRLKDEKGQPMLLKLKVLLDGWMALSLSWNSFFGILPTFFLLDLVGESFSNLLPFLPFSKRILSHPGLAAR